MSGTIIFTLPMPS